MTAFSRYGPIWECWWDGAGSTKAHYDWKRWADIVRKFQPQCVIFGCLGAAEDGYLPKRLKKLVDRE